MDKTRIIIKEFFYIFTGALVIFSLMEIIWPRIIIAYINLNWILIIWFFIGIVLLILKEQKGKNEK